MTQNLRSLISSAAVFGLFFITAYFSTFATAGNELPFPLESADQHYELAENEYYRLPGKIRRAGNHYWFEVDLEEMPQLQSATRIAFPYYYIESAPGILGNMSELVNNYVCARVQAILPSSNKNDLRRTNSQIVLKVIQRPKLMPRVSSSNPTDDCSAPFRRTH